MEIIVLIIIISLLAVILFVALKKIINSITADSKDYYFKKVQDLDAKLLEKQEKIDNEENLELKINEEIKEEEQKGNTESKLDRDLLDVINSTSYENGNALKIANEVDDIFQIDERKIIEDFIANLKVDEDYKIYQGIQDHFSPNLIFKLKMLNSETQVKVISQMLTDEEFKIFNVYTSSRKFKLNKFLLELELIIEKNLPTVEIIVGSKRKDYSDISPYIKMVYSDDVYKGMIIKYQDSIYDYSINERDV